MNDVSQIAAADFAVQVVRRLRDAGYESLLAGGCVRDMLLGRPPKDYDVATNARPEQIREIFGRRQTIPIGVAFGVIAVVGPKEAGIIEVATFRQDMGYSDGRHPDSVTFTTAEEDAQRRDFTINGIFFDPLTKENIDYVGGEEDIEQQRVRAIGNPEDRFREDKLRMLRAVRFAATLRFELEARTLDAVRAGAEQIEQVSAERISQELRKMLVHENRAAAMRLLHESRLLRTLLPELVLAIAPPETRQWSNLLAVMERLDEPTFAIVFAALMRDPVAVDERGLGLVEEIGQRLRFTNDETEGAVYLLRYESLIRSARATHWPRLQRVLITGRIDELLDFAEAVASVEGGVEDVAFCRERLRLPDDELNPRPLVNGGDLKKLGFAPGPLFKEILDAIRDDQLDGRLSTTDAATEKILATWTPEAKP